MGVSTTVDQPLKRLLEDAHHGRIQIPEFQREFVLEDEWIKELVASVSLGYSVGALMLLQAGSRDTRFGAHPIPGVPSSSMESEWLLLDGQQRLTALHHVFTSGDGVRGRSHQKAPIDRRYYIDINAALDLRADRDDTIISVEEIVSGRPGQLDVRVMESEWAQGVFPLDLVFGVDVAFRHWQRGFVNFGAAADAGSRSLLMARFETEVLKEIREYAVPTILLARETARWSVRVHGGPDGRRLSDRFRAPVG